MGKLILVADNVEPVREVLRQAIEELYGDEVRAGELRVETLADGLSVLARCLAATPDLIIMDVDMPDLDGIETFYKVRDLSSAAAANTVFLTGLAGSVEVRHRLEKAIADGAGGFFPKPASVADIKKLVDRHLYRARGLAEE